ncbi:uncharacterized protein LOC136033352 [Artemia franciscana]|uniref:uncharacterized protein LOC136033352 n=1 Tax=Artemia franciscana TaxID=6661 RepID=UPI0032DAC5C1
MDEALALRKIDHLFSDLKSDLAQHGRIEKRLFLGGTIDMPKQDCLLHHFNNNSSGSESRRTSLPAKNNAVNYFSLRGCDSSFVKRRHSYYEGKYNNIRHSYLEPAFSSGQDSCMDTNINRGTSLDSRCRMKERKTCKDKDSANLYIDGDTESLTGSKPS